MRSFLKNLGIFIGFALVLSTLTNCGGTSTTQNASTDQSTANPAENAEPAKKKTDYPPIATAVAQSDLKNLDGTTFKVADKKGKVLLLNMWATWCGPCRAEMPTLVKISKFGGIPQSFIVDRDGNLRGVVRGANPADIKKMDELVELIVNE